MTVVAILPGKPVAEREKEKADEKVSLTEFCEVWSALAGAC